MSLNAGDEFHQHPGHHIRVPLDPGASLHATPHPGTEELHVWHPVDAERTTDGFVPAPRAVDGADFDDGAPVWNGGQGDDCDCKTKKWERLSASCLESAQVS